MNLISELRAQTSQGLMDCKKMINEAKTALGENASDQEILAKAIELLQKASSKKIEKRAGRSADEGLIITNDAAGYAFIIELNCETDFVAKNESFVEFANQVAEIAAAQKPNNLTELLAAKFSDAATVADACNTMITKTGENIKISKFVVLASSSGLVAYNHGGKLAVIVEFNGDAESAKDIALHIAANNPAAIDADSINPQMLENERNLYLEQAADSGKPAEVQAKMVEGRLKKYLAEVTLMGQGYVKDDEITVAEYLAKTNTSIQAFKRVALGEVDTSEA